jgi:hypothetical protein
MDDISVIIIELLVFFGAILLVSCIIVKRHQNKIIHGQDNTLKEEISLRQENANLREVIKMLSDIEYGSYASREFYTKVIEGVSILNSMSSSIETTRESNNMDGLIDNKREEKQRALEERKDVVRPP